MLQLRQYNAMPIMTERIRQELIASILTRTKVRVDAFAFGGKNLGQLCRLLVVFATTSQKCIGLPLVAPSKLGCFRFDLSMDGPPEMIRQLRNAWIFVYRTLRSQQNMCIVSSRGFNLVDRRGDLLEKR